MTRSTLTFALAAVVTAACAPDPTAPPAATVAATFAAHGGTNPNGIGGAEPAYYDDQLFTINLKELPSGGEAAALAHNHNFNIIYESDACEPGGDEFVSVIDAVPGDGFNPLWREVQVVFPSAGACRQFTSDEEILAAAASGEVTLVPTSELYRCSVIAKPSA